MPETSVTWCWRHNWPKLPQTAEFSRMGSRAHWTRVRPTARNCSRSCCGLEGCKDQLQMARRSLSGFVMGWLFGGAQFHTFDALDEFDEAGGLRSQALKNLVVGEPSLGVKEFANFGQKDALRVNERVAVAEDGLQLFPRAQRAPHAVGQAYETNRAFIKTLRELQHVDEVFQNAGDAAVVFGRHDDEAGRFQNGVGERRERFRFLAVGRRRKNLRRQFSQVEHMHRRAEGGIDFFDLSRDLARIRSE